MILNTDWRVYFVQAKELCTDNDICTEKQLNGTGIVKCYQTDIPTANELVLMKNGVLPDLFFGENITKGYDLEYMHAFYIKNFECESGEYEFAFDGIDTVCEVYIDGEYSFYGYDMFETHRERHQLEAGKHELFIHIFPAVLASRESGAHMGDSSMTPDGDSLYVRKAAYMFGWDIFPRCVSGGIYRDISMRKVPEIDISQTYFYTVGTGGSSADVNLFYEIDFGLEKYTDYKVVFSACCGDDSLGFERTPFCFASTVRMHTDNAKLWYSAGAGEQNLYTCNLKVIRKADGFVAAEKAFTGAIRDIKLIRGSAAGEDFHFEVNGEKVFILGTNFVPLDNFPCKGKEKIPEFIEMCRDLHINMIRIWGGGFYPDDLLYDLCDKYGIMIWQDFMMGCGTYPQDILTQRVLESETRDVVRRLRQHPSIALWAGDNECDLAASWVHGNRRDPNDNVLTRKIIPSVLRDEDCMRDYLPSSPYIDEKAYKNGLLPSEDHLWGPRDYYKGEFYSKAQCAFASETGYHGCPSPESIKKFISEENLFPYHNNEWLFHCSTYTVTEGTMFSYRNDLMAAQVNTLFGYIPDNLEDYSQLSQYSQGEALKYFIERFRIGKWTRTGIIWWNLLDGAPQISDAVVDYYMVKKRAYDYIKRSQKPVCLICDEPENGFCSLYAVNDTRVDKILDFTVTDLVSGTIKLSGKATAKADSSVKIGKISTSGDFEFYKIEFNGGVNHFIPTHPAYEAALYTKLIIQI